MQESDSFCPKCGKALGQVPLMPTQTRLRGHVRLLGILWLAISAFRLIPGFVMLSIFGNRMIPFPPDVPIFVHGLLQTIGFIFLIAGALGIAAGWGLLARQPWARMLAITLGAIGLVDMPFGTALGIYTLWVLLPAESEKEYKQLAESPAFVPSRGN